MWSWFKRPKRDVPTEVQDYLDTPQPERQFPWRQVPYSVIDVETSGLNAKTDSLLAVGLVDIDEGRVRLDTCWYSLIRPPDGLVVSAESIRIHQLMRGELSQAPPAEEVLIELLQHLKGRVLIVHVAAIDVNFINRALDDRWGVKLHKGALDTARLAHAIHANERYINGIETEAPSIQLRALTQTANLPMYAQHNALSDAITAAQLFLMQATKIEAHGGKKLKDLIRAGGA